MAIYHCILGVFGIVAAVILALNAVNVGHTASGAGYGLLIVAVLLGLSGFATAQRGAAEMDKKA